jgi:hypothetical protein
LTNQPTSLTRARTRPQSCPCSAAARASWAPCRSAQACAARCSAGPPHITDILHRPPTGIVTSPSSLGGGRRRRRKT